MRAAMIERPAPATKQNAGQLAENLLEPTSNAILRYFEDASQEPVLRAYLQLPSQAQELVASMIRTLAEQNGISVPYTASPGLQEPSNGLALWESYMVAEGFSARTVRFYMYTVTKYLASDPIPSELSIRSYLANEFRRGIGATRVKDILKALKSFFGFLYDSGLWNHNPTSRIKYPKLPKRERQIPSTEDVFKLLAMPKSPKAQAYLSLLTDTGGRYDEIVRLTWDRVNFETGEIVVIGKGNKERVLPISDVTRAILIAYRQTLNGSKMVFPSNDKRGAWDNSAANRILSRLCKKAGIPKITAHQLRHFFASYTLEGGGEGSLKALQELLGHADIKTTSIYLHTDRAKIRKIHERHSPLSVFSLPLLGEGKDQ